MTSLLGAFLRLIRINSGITAAVLVIISARLTDAPFAPRTLALLMATVIFATSAGNALNDVFDCQIDCIGKPGRPLPSGKISPAAASTASATLFALAIICSSLISPWCTALCIGNVIVLIIYARYSKRMGFFKDLVVGYLVGSVTLFGTTSLQLLNVSTMTLALCAMLATMARELIKDIEDKDADAGCAARTIPILIGDARAYRFAYACLVVALAAAFIPYLTGDMGGRYIAVICAGGLVFAASLLSSRARTRQNAVMAGSVIELAGFYLGNA